MNERQKEKDDRERETVGERDSECNIGEKRDRKRGIADRWKSSQ